MRRITFLFAVFFTVSFLLAGCFGWNGNNSDDVFPEPQSNYTPVIMQRVDFENAVSTEAVQNVIKSGKIYIFDNFLFINDVNKGFHVYNYSNPENPIPLCFLKTPGATDLAIRNGILYINQATDLLTLVYDFQSNSFTILHRNNNVFPQKISPDGFYTDLGQNEIIVDWVVN